MCGRPCERLGVVAPGVADEDLIRAMKGGGTCKSSAGYISHKLTGSGGFAPISAKTQTFHRPVGPIAYDCVKVIIVRDGSAILFSEFGQRLVKLGDAVLLCANTLCGSEPEGRITATTVYMDTDYLIDQVFWQHVGLLRDRLDARDLAARMYLEPAQILRLGEERAGMLMPWLDELVHLSVEGEYMRRFNRIQALWFTLADVIAPFVRSHRSACQLPSGPEFVRHHPGAASSARYGKKHGRLPIYFALPPRLTGLWECWQTRFTCRFRSSCGCSRRRTARRL